MSEMPLARIEHDTDALSRNDPTLLTRLSRFLLVRNGQICG